MAKLYGEIAAKALLTLDKSFARANGQPLDASEVYYSLQAAEDYAKTAQAYIGQKIVVIENGVVTHYSVEDAEGTLKEVGSTPLGTTGQIVVDPTTKKISLYGVEGLAFEEDILGENGQPTGDKAEVRYQPLMTKDGLIWIKPSTITVEGLNTIVESLNQEVTAIGNKVGNAAKPESTEGAGDAVAATGLYKVIEDAVGAIEIPVEGIADGEKILSLTGKKLSTTLSIVKTKKVEDGKTYIQLLGKDSEVISEFDAAEFIADGMLESVTKDTETNEIIFKWNTSAGVTETKIDIDDLVEVYTAGNGIDIKNFVVSVKRDSTSEDFLTVGADGIKLSGVQNAIDTAKQAAIDDADGKLANKANSADVYTKTKVDEIHLGLQSNIDNLAGTGRTTETVKGNADAIAAIKDSNTIDSFADVVTALAGKQDKLTEGAYATESYVDGKVNALANGAVATAQAQADKGVEDAAAAKRVADTANAQANTNKTKIGIINTTLNGDNNAEEGSAERLGLIGRIAAVEEYKSTHEGAFTTLSQTVAGHGTDITKLQQDLGTTNGIVNGHTTSITNLTEEVGKKANAATTYTKDEVNAITGTPDSGKTLVQMIKDHEGNVYTKEEIGDLEDISSSLTLTKYVSALNTAITTIQGNDTTSSIRTVAAEEAAAAVAAVDHLTRSVVETLPSVEAAEENVIYMVKDPNATGDQYKEYMLLSGALVQIGDTSVDLSGYARTEDVIAGIRLDDRVINPDEQNYVNIPVAGTNGVLGVVTSVSGDTLNGVAVASDGTMSVNSISTDKLVQGTKTLIISGGKANTATTA